MTLLLAALWLGPAARAADVEEAQRVQLEKARAEVADQVHLAAFDLVDELVYGWTLDPVFEAPTAVVLAEVTVPVGLGTALRAQLENHLGAVLLANPSTNVQLVHCPQCTAVVVHSGPEATVISRGFDNPSVLADLGADTGKHALFVDVEAEGSFLVLRARLTRLTPDLPIVWSHTIASAAGAAPLLREPDRLMSASEARDVYLDALHDRGLIFVPVRLAIRTYAAPGDGGVPPPPFLWLQTGVELSPTDARAWTSSLIVGYSFIPQAYQGIMAQARVNRLITGRSRALTRPDLYLFAGAAAMSVWGAATASFIGDEPDADDIITAITGEGPRTSFGAIQVGLDLRVGQRIGASVFLETLPDLARNINFGTYVRPFGVGFQSFGTEVTFWL